MTALTGQRAWIVGGGSGIGAAVALSLAGEGAAIVLSGRRADALAATGRHIENAGGTAFCLPIDIADPAAVTAAEPHLRDIDILVFAAGVNISSRALDALDPADWSRVVDINLGGAFHTTRAVLPGMRRRQAGTIVIVSSWAGWRLEPVAGAAYSSTKHALLAFAETINIEEGKNGIRATCLCPAEVDTEILSTRPNPPSDADRSAMLRADDVASLVRFVATSPARVCVNQIVVSPTTNRFYGGQISRVETP